MSVGAAPRALLAALLAGLLCAATPARAATPLTDAIASVVGISAGDATGTGFVTQSGIITAGHVVAGTREVTVSQGGSDQRGRVVRVDPVLDLALIASPLPDAPPLRFDPVPELGEPVTVVAVDRFDGPVLTRGIVSALPTDNGIRFVQVDAAVNPGTSGAPVLNSDGAVLGLVVTKDRLRDDVGRAHVAPDLEAFLAGDESPARSTQPVAARDTPAKEGWDVPPFAVAGLALGLVVLGTGASVRRRRFTAGDAIHIHLGPVTEVDDIERPHT